MSKLINYVFSGFFKQDSCPKIEVDQRTPSLNQFQDKNLFPNMVTEGVLMANSNSFVDLDKNLKLSNDNKIVEYFHKERLSIPEFNQSFDLIDLTKFIYVILFNERCMNSNLLSA
jgi:hypothetical protein